MSTFKYTLQKDLSKNNVAVHQNLLSNVQGIGSLVLYGKGLEALEGLLGSQDAFNLWVNFLKNPNSPIRLSTRMLNKQVSGEIKDLHNIESHINNEPIDLLVLDEKNSKELSKESLVLSNDKEITNPNLLRTSETFKYVDKLRRKMILGREDGEKVWETRFLPLFEGATSVSLVERNFFHQHIESDNKGPKIILDKILEIPTIKQLDVIAESPKNKPSQEEMTGVLVKLLRRVNRKDVELNFYLGGYKQGRAGSIFGEKAKSSYLHLKGLTWQEKILCDHICELFNYLGAKYKFGSADKTFTVGPIEHEDSEALEQTKKLIKTAFSIEDNSTKNWPSLVLKRSSSLKQ